ncbi:MAG: class F sortase [Patescibacteria group bacterium]|nr:class F sortase [Patescibacteria group bacterium]
MGFYFSRREFLLTAVLAIFSGLSTFIVVSAWYYYKYGLIKLDFDSLEFGVGQPEVQAEAKSYPLINSFSNLVETKVFFPVFLNIPKINLIDVPIVKVSRTLDDRLGVPQSFETVGWFEGGARPGENGNAVIDGHYDKTDGSPAIFYNLINLSVGDEIQIKDERSITYLFKIIQVIRINVTDERATQKAYADTKEPTLTLITCGGVWNSKEHNYSQRLLVKARLEK